MPLHSARLALCAGCNHITRNFCTNLGQASRCPAPSSYQNNAILNTHCIALSPFLSFSVGLFHLLSRWLPSQNLHTGQIARRAVEEPDNGWKNEKNTVRRKSTIRRSLRATVGRRTWQRPEYLLSAGKRKRDERGRTREQEKMRSKLRPFARLQFRKDTTVDRRPDATQSDQERSKSEYSLHISGRFAGGEVPFGVVVLAPRPVLSLALHNTCGQSLSESSPLVAPETSCQVE